MTDFTAARHNMVESQVKPNDITNHALISAMRNIAREAFLPDNLRSLAYMDDDIQISTLGEGRYMMEPRVLSKLIQLADIEPGDHILDIGCGTGYSTAILAQLGSSVVGLEANKTLADQATSNLASQNIDNIAIVSGKMEQGLASQGPYDVIFFSGRVDQVPENIKNQLKDGGRLVAVLSSSGTLGSATLFVRSSEVISERSSFEANINPLPGFKRQKGFVF